MLNDNEPKIQMFYSCSSDDYVYGVFEAKKHLTVKYISLSS